MISMASFFFRKSGVNISIVVSGDFAQIDEITFAK